MKKFQVITLFPEFVESFFTTSMMWKAHKEGLVEFSTVNLRDFGLGPRKTVDDTPYGGGDGMLLMIEPLVAALEFAKGQDPTAKVLLMTPTDNFWDQQHAGSYAASDDSYIIICGRYEGFDARIDHFIDEKISVGRYVLTGGEIPAMIVIDSVVRLMPGVLGGETSAEIESYSEETELEFPQYTRPETFRDMQVPEVLLSGNHAAIQKWRNDNSVKL
ncbi:MAG TPA: tRNA (guanosine(37)-N1)-methyltransferase TrmD [Candidatus Nanoperiomorbaceae bacterium]|nr:tRNA (guanosine(37)-N1)-methyltransferase TrmD [Candidatus Nanoperiomorbaceae bacterium]HMQ97235.1 tRNA (guanosine(37)-N1)-methyltransferase TrmD [Candidatus Nanoperiomorbaceae bacterium]